jgi:bifunctional NMN adenylyltransferase/nudix hydrolase
MQYDLAVFIGRFQPPHFGHLRTIIRTFELAKKTLIIIGDYKTARSIKNPFTFDEVKKMILDSLPKEFQERLIFEPVRNYPYHDELWIASVQKLVSSHSESSVCLMGHLKDSSSYYLYSFPQWKFEPSEFLKGMNATDVREFYFEDVDLKNELEKKLPLGTIQFLDEFKKTEIFSLLKEEFEFLKKYKTIWANSPYPPTFVTTDSVVLKSGHVLIVKRKSNPGKGLYSLPGGFLAQEETIEQGAIRELIEETGIKVPKTELKSSIKAKEVFDKPDRSLRGRTVTHSFYFDLGIGELPKVRGGERADKVIWMSISELYENMENFFEDHFSIIEFFIYKA